MLVLATVVLLLVALVAAAGFVVVAQRRLRQLGMMAAVGASDRHLRLVVVANGLVVGVIAAITGTVIGVLAWFAVAPALEGAAGHRIGRFDVPWWVLGVGVALAVLTAAAAAWWPARAMARVPIVQALSARPPRPRVGGRSALVAVALIATGFVCLSAGIDVKHDKANVALLIPGTIAIALGRVVRQPARHPSAGGDGATVAGLDAVGVARSWSPSSAIWRSPRRNQPGRRHRGGHGGDRHRGPTRRIRRKPFGSPGAASPRLHVGSGRSRTHAGGDRHHAGRDRPAGDSSP